jgi:hypothetical protein
MPCVIKSASKENIYMQLAKPADVLFRMSSHLEAFQRDYRGDFECSTTICTRTSASVCADIFKG